MSISVQRTLRLRPALLALPSLLLLVVTPHGSGVAGAPLDAEPSQRQRSFYLTDPFSPQRDSALPPQAWPQAWPQGDSEVRGSEARDPNAALQQSRLQLDRDLDFISQTASNSRLMVLNRPVRASPLAHIIADIIDVSSCVRRHH